MRIPTVLFDADMNPNRTKDGRFGDKGARFDPMTQAKTRLSNQYSELRKMQRESDDMANSGESGSPAHQRKLAAIEKKKQSIAETHDMMDRLKGTPVSQPSSNQKTSAQVLESLKKNNVQTVGDVTKTQNEKQRDAHFLEQLSLMEKVTGIDSTKFLESFSHLPKSEVPAEEPVVEIPEEDYSLEEIPPEEPK